MKILWVATKAPWPAVDGGRLLMDLSLRGLRDLGHDVTVVAPVRLGDTVRPEDTVRSGDATPTGSVDGIRWLPVSDPFRPKALDVLRAWPWGAALSTVRHRSQRVCSQVARLWADEPFDVVHIEQVQAFGNLAELDVDPDFPAVLRAQNVESDLWRLLAPHRPWIAPAIRLEARFLARAEGRAVQQCRATAALTEQDAKRLDELAGGSDELAGGQRNVAVIPPPFPEWLPPSDESLEGDPALVVLGSSGWIPNRQGADWWVREIWPRVASHYPGAILHLFGSGAEAEQSEQRIVRHGSLESSRRAFAPNSVLIVPLQIASGVRMKILEAWARGVPVIATPTAARGLAATNGVHLAEASSAEDFIDALGSLRDGRAYSERVAAGRNRLRQAHDPLAVAKRWTELYESVGRGPEE